MKALLIIVIVLVVTTGVLVLVRGWIADRRKRRPGAWRVEERSDGELVTLRAVRRDDEPLLLGHVHIAATDFDDRISALREQARVKVDAINEGG